MTALDQFFELVWRQCWQVTLLILVVLAISKTLGSRRPHLAFVLWLVVLVKCVTPPVFHSSAGVFCWVGSERTNSIPENSAHSMAVIETQSRLETSRFAQITESSANPIVVSQIPSSNDQAVTAFEAVEHVGKEHVRAQQPLWLLLICVWLMGMLAVASLALGQTWAFMRRIRSDGLTDKKDVQAIVDRLAAALMIRRRVHVRVTKHRIGPAIYGLIHATVVLPELFVTKLSDENLEHIVAHELIHLRRGDLLASLLNACVRALWWFNPLVWLACNRVSHAAEICCDEQTVASLGCDPKRYAESLLRVLDLRHRLQTAPALPGIKPFELTEKRLERVMSLKQGCDKRTPNWCWTVFLISMFLVVPGASIVAREAQIKKADTSPTQSKEERVADGDESKPGRSNSGRPARVKAPAKLDREPSDVELINLEIQWASVPSSVGPRDWQVVQVEVDRDRADDPKAITRLPVSETIGSAITVIKKRQPLHYACLDPSKANKLMTRLNESPSSSVMLAPTIRFKDGRYASVSDTRDQPFVVAHNGEPQVQLLPNGTEILCHGWTVDDDSVWLDLTLSLSKIRQVTTSSVATTHDKVADIEIPEHEISTYRIALKVDWEKTLVVRADSNQDGDNQLLVMVTPSLSKADQDEAPLEPSSDPEVGSTWELSFDECLQAALSNSEKLQAYAEVQHEHGAHVIQCSSPEVSTPMVEYIATSLTSETIRAYWELDFFCRSLAFTKSARDQSLQEWKIVFARMEQGIDGEEKEAQAREQYYTFQSRVESELANRKKSELRLRYLIGYAANDGRSIVPSSSVELSEPTLDREELCRLANMNSPTLRQQRLAIERYVSRAKSLIDQLSAMGTNAESPQKRELQELRSRIRNAQARLAKMKSETVYQIDDAITSLESQDQLTRTASNRLEAAKKQVRSVRFAYQSGTVALDLLLDAQRRCADASTAHAQAVTQAKLAKVTLQFRSATLLEDYGIRMASSAPEFNIDVPQEHMEEGKQGGGNPKSQDERHALSFYLGAMR